jgi:hypothetical protein
MVFVVIKDQWTSSITAHYVDRSVVIQGKKARLLRNLTAFILQVEIDK